MTTAEEKKSAIQKREQRLDREYYNLFEGRKDGQTVFADLSHRFYDRTSVTGTPVDANAALVLEGQRQVMLYIMGRITRFQAQQEDDGK